MTPEQFKSIAKTCPWQTDRGECMARPTDFTPRQSYECNCCGSAAEFEWDSCEILNCGIVHFINKLIVSI